jgi:hypothetical protein
MAPTKENTATPVSTVTVSEPRTGRLGAPPGNSICCDSFEVRVIT